MLIAGIQPTRTPVPTAYRYIWSTLCWKSVKGRICIERAAFHIFGLKKKMLKEVILEYDMLRKIQDLGSKDKA